MLKVILTRSITTIPLLLFVSLLIFSMLFLMPGSAAKTLLGEAATPERIAALEAELGLDAPYWVQYGRWLQGAVMGDLGTSLRTGRPVWSTVFDKLPVTLAITAGGMAIAIVLGVGAGIVAALYAGSWLDRTTIIGAATGMAVPPFWLALALSALFAVQLRWFPVIGYTPFRLDGLAWARSLVLPSVALGLPASALIARQMRSALREVLATTYIRAARAGGASQWRVIRQHALRNAMIPVVTVIGFRVALVLGSAFVVEQVFSLPGMGTLLVTAVLEQDLPVVQGAVMVIATLIILTNLLVDISYGWLDPKVRVA